MSSCHKFWYWVLLVSGSKTHERVFNNFIRKSAFSLNFTRHAYSFLNSVLKLVGGRRAFCTNELTLNKISKGKSSSGGGSTTGPRLLVFDEYENPNSWLRYCKRELLITIFLKLTLSSWGNFKTMADDWPIREDNVKSVVLIHILMIKLTSAEV